MEIDDIVVSLKRARVGSGGGGGKRRRLLESLWRREVVLIQSAWRAYLARKRVRLVRFLFYT